VKTTVQLPDDLLIAAKKRAAETRTTLREVMERSLRRELQGEKNQKPRKRRKIRLLTVDGGSPPGLDISDREKMHEWLEANG
jgi:hypothetical protein